MPYAPKRGCRHAGCKNLAEKGSTYCTEHAPKKTQKEIEREEDYKHSPARVAANKKYDARWVALRNAYIHKHPLCERCLDQGRLTGAQEVHHIKPLSQGGQHIESNLISLCRSCHNYMHYALGDRKPYGATERPED